MEGSESSRISDEDERRSDGFGTTRGSFLSGCQISYRHCCMATSRQQLVILCSMEEPMYHNAEILLPRKKVWEAFHSNTFRIFDETLPERLDPVRVYQNHRRPVTDPQESETRNAPHPHNVGFIRTNVRLLNQPIAHMGTKHTGPEQSDWWSDSRDEAPPVTAAYSRASTQRSDFQPIRDAPVRERQTSRAAARGIIPALSSLDRSENLTDQRHE